MIQLTLASKDALAWAQEVVSRYHYLKAPVDSRCSAVGYIVWHEMTESPMGCLIFGRPEATRCFDGALTYGSQQDVATGRAQYDRWELLNLARVWLHPAVQQGGRLCTPACVPGYTDRRGVWRPKVASHVIGMALARVGYDYLSQRPPVFPDEPYEIKVVLSYCDTRVHKGTIYKAAGFQRARVNERGIETWFTTDVAPLSSYEHDMVNKLAWGSKRGMRLRAKRAQLALEGM